MKINIKEAEEKLTEIGSRYTDEFNNFLEELTKKYPLKDYSAEIISLVISKALSDTVATLGTLGASNKSAKKLLIQMYMEVLENEMIKRNW